MRRILTSAGASRWWARRFYVGCGGVTATRPLLAQRKTLSQLRDPNKPWESHDTLGYTAHEELMSDKDIFDDPSSKLFNDDLQEMSTEELEDFMTHLSSAYNPIIYAYLTIPTVDLVHILHQRALIPRVQNDSLVTTWFSDPVLVLKKPSVVAEWMGESRWESFSSGARELLDEVSEVLPLMRVCSKHALPRDKWVPFMRQLSVELMHKTATRSRTMEQLASFFVAVANGRGSASLGLPDDDKQRIVLLANLLLGVAQESGNSQLAFAALHLQQAHHVALSYTQQKTLMNVVAYSTKRALDWDLRSSGQLKRAAAEWLSKYFPAIVSGSSMTGWAIEDAETSDTVAVSGALPAATEAAKAEGDGSVDVPAADGPASGADDSIIDEGAKSSMLSVSNVHHYFTMEHEKEKDIEGIRKRVQLFAASAKELIQTREAKEDMKHARNLVKASLKIAESEVASGGGAKVIPIAADKRKKVDGKTPRTVPVRGTKSGARVGSAFAPVPKTPKRAASTPKVGEASRSAQTKISAPRLKKHPFRSSANEQRAAVAKRSRK